MALTIATFGIAALALSNALGNTIEPALPDLAALQLGANPDIRLRAALERTIDGDFRKIESTARAAVQAQPLNSLALGALGVSIEQRGGNGSPFILLADRQSRRTALAQLWLLEASVAKGDIGGALDRYDILMSLSSEYWQMLMPVLDKALAEPQIVREFASHLRDRRTWTSYFFAYMSDQGEDPTRLARVVLLSGGVAHARGLGLDSSRLLDRLTTAGKADLVRALFLSDPKGDRTLLDRPLLSDRAFDPALAPVTWQFSTASASNVFPEQRDGRSTLRIVVDPDSQARVLRKLLFLPAGSYRFGYTLDPVRIGQETSATWRWSCADTGRALGQQAITLASRSGAAEISVPDGCRSILLDLSAAGGSDQSGSELVVETLDLRRMS